MLCRWRYSGFDDRYRGNCLELVPKCLTLGGAVAFIFKGHIENGYRYQLAGAKQSRRYLDYEDARIDCEVAVKEKGYRILTSAEMNLL